MRSTDLPELERRLTAICDVFGSRAPGKEALRVWLDTLTECDASDVWGVLVEWPKSHNKPPLPAEVFKIARDMAINRRERVAAAEKQIGKDFAPEKLTGGETLAYRAFRASMAALRHLPKPHPKSWASELKALEDGGEMLNQAQKQNWRAALAHKETIDDESRLEREAIQAES